MAAEEHAVKAKAQAMAQERERRKKIQEGYVPEGKQGEKPKNIWSKGKRGKNGETPEQTWAREKAMIASGMKEAGGDKHILYIYIYIIAILIVYMLCK